MYKSILVVAFVCVVALVEAGSHNEGSEVQDRMKEAFSSGLERFGGAVARRDEKVPMPSYENSKVFSLYSQGLKAPGGGKPSVLEQYRKHSFTPLTPKVVPEEHKPYTGKMSPSDAAARFVPQPPLQYASDRFHL